MLGLTEQSRVALVTGANRGIGLEVARQLAEVGNCVILGSRDLAKGKQAANALTSKNVHPVQLDITSQSDIKTVAARVASDFHRLDILVNNAGVLLDETDQPSETEPEIIRATLETNVLGTWRLSQAFIPMMKKQKYGRIVNVSSSAGSIRRMEASPYAPAYSLSKTSLNALTIMLATELRGSGILVNSVCPGWVRTDMGGANAPRSVKEGADTIVWLATLPNNGPSGGFFQDRARIEW